MVATAAAAQDYTRDGPCAVQKVAAGPQIMPGSTGCKLKACLLKVTVTLPQTGQAAGSACASGPFPVVFFYSAFQTPSASYKAYANRLASYGYAVVQYDTALGTIITDNVELQFMQLVLDNLKAQATASSSSSSPLAGRLDFSVLAVAGHSRGGKLAALQLATSPAVKAGYLIDPVDNTIFSPESALYPSAVKALAAATPRRVAGVSGAKIPSLCNPPDANYEKFYAALGSGSWLQVLPQATHLSFAQTPLAATPICGKGSTTPLVGVPVTVATVTAWMEQAVRGRPLPAEFTAWVNQKAQEGVLTFTVKQ